ncbi:DUF4349 domain-containing protein [Conexibacter arvalis]|uniref:DUF4349 domain-containing protein n=1 Tax=Conexibacter arvalis TaxID=912552 RepID=A0A840IA03_9ACTN|nr:DUF4349 domain-containing protein [Conexibacter arvalis]MBB4661185.1 hypothetical protein [Conexibacter arvalis]
MRRRSSAPDPTAARELAAIDAALAGNPVGAEEADLARLATALVAERPRSDPEFRAALDARVATRFAGARADAFAALRSADGGSAAVGGSNVDGASAANGGSAADGASGTSAANGGAPATARRTGGGTRRRGLLARIPFAPAATATGLAALVAIVVAVDVTGGGGGTSDSPVSGGAAISDALSGGAASDTDGGTAARDADGGAALESAAPPLRFERESAAPLQGRRRGLMQAASGAGGAGAATAPPLAAQSAPPASGAARKIERSASVELGAPADRLGDVAQGVLGVVARNGGIVDASTVATREDGGEARFDLRIPADRLQRALAQLSDLPDARALSRTDEALDVNQAHVTIRRRLSAAEARRTATANALRAATDQEEIDRLSGELQTLDRRIAAWERDQRALDRRVDFSRVTLTVRTDERASEHDDGAFTPGAAFDDAGRLLAVTAGVAVIAAAALVPLALLAACAWPLARALRRRRREQALDAV